MAVYVNRLRLMGAMTAEEITTSSSASRSAGGSATPCAVIHRGDPHGVRLRGCRNNPHITLRASSEVISYTQGGTTVTARLASGDTITGTARRRRAMVQCTQTGGRRRAAARLRPHHLPLGHSGRANAVRAALDAVTL
jgi:hypothetical protein